MFRVTWMIFVKVLVGRMLRIIFKVLATLLEFGKNGYAEGTVKSALEVFLIERAQVLG